MNDATTLEFVTFKAVAGTKDGDMRKAVHAVTPLLKEYRGFVSRSIAQADDGSWINAVYWKDRTSAESAANAIIQAPPAQAFLALIDQSSMVFRHAVITAKGRKMAEATDARLKALDRRLALCITGTDVAAVQRVVRSLLNTA